MKLRSLAAVGAAAIALLSAASPAWADEAITAGSWNGSALDPGPTSVAVGAYELSGTFRRELNRQVEVTVSTDPTGSGPCTVTPATLPRANAPRAFNVTLTVPCNGIYTVKATAVTTDNAFLPSDSATLDRRVTVSAPAPTVTGVEATSRRRVVTVTWDDMLVAAPDLTGYVVERKVGSGDFIELDAVAASTPSYVDDQLPTAGGTAAYRISATRPSPDGERISAASAESATTFAAVSESDPGPAGGSDGSGSGGSDGSGTTGGTDGSGSDGGSTAASGGGSSASGSRARVSPPRVFSGSFLPPLLRPASQTVTTPTTADTGYDESLPYELREGDEDPVLPNDAMASILTDGQPGRGLVIPVATALVFAIWAIHLRMLARASRPLD